MSSTSRKLAENLARVRERIEVAASRAGRRAEDITLIAVSKTHSAETIRELYEAGARHFGENRVQEREAKAADLTGLAITWHMIGHVQKNKATRAARLFDATDSVDSVAVAERLNNARADFVTENKGDAEGGKTKGIAEISTRAQQLRVLIEAKLDPEPAKTGIGAEELPRLAEAILKLPHLDLRGLMGVPPYFDDPEQARPFFRHLRELRDTLRAHLGRETLPVLSMGMSHDFEIAIEEAATEIRVGTALFGSREKA
jgi:pyridoxal phosphate enzyme (YggS family)